MNKIQLRKRSILGSVPVVAVSALIAKALGRRLGGSGTLSAMALALVLGGSALAQHPIPGKIEAESYSAMNGVMKENTTDTGGGQNVGGMHTGDWMDYSVFVGATSTYTVHWRVASTSGEPRPQLELRKSDGTALTSFTPDATGGWQIWATQTTTGVPLSAGAQTLRIHVVFRQDGGSGVNLNWFEFVSESSQTYTLSASAGANGAISPSGDVVVPEGASQTFAITPSFGYRVADVLVDSVSVGAVSSYSFNAVTANHTISATFAVDTTPYSLTVVNGTGDGAYTAGTVVNVAADTPPVGMQFFAWSGGTAHVADPNAANTTVSMPQANVTITATYMPPGLIAFEPFDYLSGTVFTNGIANGGGGWSGGWFKVNNNTFQASTIGLTYPGLNPAPVGGSGIRTNEDKPGAIRTLSSPPASGVFYVSALFDQWYFWSLMIGLKQSHEYRTFAGFGLGGGEEGPWQPRATAGNSFGNDIAGQSGGLATTGTRFIVAKVDLAAKTISIYADRAAGSVEPDTPDASYAFSAWYDPSKGVDQLAMFSPSRAHGRIDEIRVATTWDAAFGFVRPPSGMLITIR